MSRTEMPECPVACFGRELLRAVRAHDRLEAVPERRRTGRDEAVLLQLLDRIETLQAEVTQHRARSLEGALYQVLALESVRSVLILRQQDPEARAALERLKACMHSLAGLLAEQSGVAIDDSGSWFLQPAADPQLVFERLRSGEEWAR